MEIIEKNLPGREPELFDEGGLDRISRWPIFLVKWMIRRNILAIRKSMGGESKDITKRQIFVEDHFIKGWKENIRVRVYTPAVKKNRPLFVFYHGGGWIGGSLWAVEQFVKGVCDQADAVGISVEYHLAPEHTFPEGLEDCYLAVKWAVDNADMLGIDMNNITLAGDSAGGNFAAVISLLARERQEFGVKKQVLIYPATDLLDWELDENASISPGMQKYQKALIGTYIDGEVEWDDFRVSPVYASLENMPETLVAVGTKDFLYRSTMKFTQKVDQAGNLVKFMKYLDANHAFIDFTGYSQQANDLVSETADFIMNNG